MAGIPETVIKRTKRRQKREAAKRNAAVQDEAERTANASAAFAREKEYLAKYEALERETIAKEREAKAAGNYYLQPESKVVFAIRVRGIVGVSPKVRKVLQLLRLRQLHNGVFIRLNKATINMLRLVEPFVAYGYPNLKTIRGLLYKRGFCKINKQRVPIMDNAVIAGSLGNLGIKSVPDLIHEIFTCGDNFKQANNFLWLVCAFHNDVTWMKTLRVSPTGVCAICDIPSSNILTVHLILLVKL